MRDVGDLLAEPAGAKLPPNLRPLLLETPGTFPPGALADQIAVFRRNSTVVERVSTP